MGADIAARGSVKYTLNCPECGAEIEEWFDVGSREPGRVECPECGDDSWMFTPNGEDPEIVDENFAIYTAKRMLFSASLWVGFAIMFSGAVSQVAFAPGQQLGYAIGAVTMFIGILVMDL